jgi:hypothetical protein
MAVDRHVKLSRELLLHYPDTHQPFHTRPLARLQDPDRLFRPPLPVDLVIEFHIRSGLLNVSAHVVHSTDLPPALIQITKPFEHLGDHLSTLFQQQRMSARAKLKGIRFKRVSAMQADRLLAPAGLLPVQTTPTPSIKEDNIKPFAFRKYQHAVVSTSATTVGVVTGGRWSRALIGLNKMDRLVGDFLDKLCLFE